MMIDSDKLARVGLTAEAWAGLPASAQAALLAGIKPEPAGDINVTPRECGKRALTAVGYIVKVAAGAFSELAAADARGVAFDAVREAATASADAGPVTADATRELFAAILDREGLAGLASKTRAKAADVAANREEAQAANPRGGRGRTASGPDGAVLAALAARRTQAKY